METSESGLTESYRSLYTPGYLLQTANLKITLLINKSVSIIKSSRRQDCVMAPRDDEYRNFYDLSALPVKADPGADSETFINPCKVSGYEAPEALFY